MLDHLRQALEHALDALRCYASMFAAEGEARLTRSMHSMVCALALVALMLLSVYTPIFNMIKVAR